MKSFLISLFLLVVVVAQAQNVLRVNNIPGINGVYPTIQAAVTAASAGDIILVDGSPIQYNGDFNLTKKLTIRGPGYFLAENTAIQANQNPATINPNSFYFSPGSDGSVVSGLVFLYRVEVKTSNITISNNQFTGATYAILLSNAAAAANLLITGNYIDVTSNQALLSNAQIFTGVIVSNNVILNEQGSGFCINWTVPTFGTIKNNIIRGGNANTIGNCDIVDNIFLDTWANTISNSVNSTIRNNVFVGPSQANADLTNLYNANPAALFIGLPGNTTDTQWKLKANSSAIGAGALAEDCGIYGGVTPYNISGVAAGLSTITSFSVPGAVPQNGTLNVKVSAKVN